MEMDFNSASMATKIIALDLYDIWTVKKKYCDENLGTYVFTI